MLTLLPAKSILILEEIVFIHKFGWGILTAQGLGKVLELMDYREQGLGVSAEVRRGLSFGVLGTKPREHPHQTSLFCSLNVKPCNIS